MLCINLITIDKMLSWGEENKKLKERIKVLEKAMIDQAYAAEATEDRICNPLLDELKKKHKAELNNLKQEHEVELKIIQESSQENIGTLKTTFDNQLQNVTQECKAQLDTYKFILAIIFACVAAGVTGVLLHKIIKTIHKTYRRRKQSNKPFRAQLKDVLKKKFPFMKKLLKK